VSVDKLPFNIDLLSSVSFTRSLPEIRSLDIYERQDHLNFHPEGLYSTEIFGRMGEPARDNQFAFIDMKVPVLHPVIFKTLTTMRALYKNILSGKTYAVFNEKTSDFEASNAQDGKTGYAFFMSHFKSLALKRNRSKKRDLKIDLIEKYQDKATVKHLIVIPAGLRDLENSDGGRVKEDEINDLYRRVLSIAKTISVTQGNLEGELFNSVRWSMQVAFNQIYETLRTMIEGKRGFIQSKWGRRKIFNGTRNVISAMTTSAVSSDDPKMPDVHDTMVGLFQTLKGCLPLSMYCIRQGLIGQVFSQSDSGVRLIDPKTLKLVTVDVKPATIDKMVSSEGLEQLINQFQDRFFRNRYASIDDHYIGLIYDNGTEVKIFNDITQLPDDRKIEDVRPITWAELLYLNCYERFDKVKCVVTRYPVTGIGSTYYSRVYLRTTTTGLVRYVLNDVWERDEDKLLAKEMPNTDHSDSYMDSAMVHGSRLAGLGGDYDGDMISVNYLYSKAVDDVERYLNSKDAYLDPRGGLQQASTDLIDWALFNLTRA
tara:strand:+ start:632 stop:2251 length:1620 start_codon:yes stop_codon:yes gene_type:complete